MWEVILLVVCVPMFLAGCWMLIVMERESRQCTVTSGANIVPLSTSLGTPITNPLPFGRPRHRLRGRPHLYVLPPLDQSKSKLS